MSVWNPSAPKRVPIRSTERVGIMNAIVETLFGGSGRVEGRVEIVLLFHDGRIMTGTAVPIEEAALVGPDRSIELAAKNHTNYAALEPLLVQLLEGDVSFFTNTGDHCLRWQMTTASFL